MMTMIRLYGILASNRVKHGAGYEGTCIRGARTRVRARGASRASSPSGLPDAALPVTEEARRPALVFSELVIHIVA